MNCETVEVLIRQIDDAYLIGALWLCTPRLHQALARTKSFFLHYHDRKGYTWPSLIKHLPHVERVRITIPGRLMNASKGVMSKINYRDIGPQVQDLHLEIPDPDEYHFFTDPKANDMMWPNLRKCIIWLRTPSASNNVFLGTRVLQYWGCVNTLEYLQGCWYEGNDVLLPALKTTYVNLNMKNIPNITFWEAFDFKEDPEDLPASLTSYNNYQYKFEGELRQDLNVPVMLRFDNILQDDLTRWFRHLRLLNVYYKFNVSGSLRNFVGRLPSDLLSLTIRRLQPSSSDELCNITWPCKLEELCLNFSDEIEVKHEVILNLPPALTRLAMYEMRGPNSNRLNLVNPVDLPYLPPLLRHAHLPWDAKIIKLFLDHQIRQQSLRELEVTTDIVNFSFPPGLTSLHIFYLGNKTLDFTGLSSLTSCTIRQISSIRHSLPRFLRKLILGQRSFTDQLTTTLPDSITHLKLQYIEDSLDTLQVYHFPRFPAMLRKLKSSYPFPIRITKACLKLLPDTVMIKCVGIGD